jgi:hypothetical protein
MYCGKWLVGILFVMQLCDSKLCLKALTNPYFASTYCDVEQFLGSKFMGCLLTHSKICHEEKRMLLADS